MSLGVCEIARWSPARAAPASCCVCGVVLGRTRARAALRPVPARRPYVGSRVRARLATGGVTPLPFPRRRARAARSAGRSLTMSKGTAIKDAIKQFETAKGVVAADAEKARGQRNTNASAHAFPTTFAALTGRAAAHAAPGGAVRALPADRQDGRLAGDAEELQVRRRALSAGGAGRAFGAAPGGVSGARRARGALRRRCAAAARAAAHLALRPLCRRRAARSAAARVRPMRRAHTHTHALSRFR
jgi:hypothetical protein